METLFSVPHLERRAVIVKASNEKLFTLFEQAYYKATCERDVSAFDLAVELGAELTVPTNNPRWPSITPHLCKTTTSMLTALEWFPEAMDDRLG